MMSDQVIIRRAVTGDADAIVPCFNDAVNDKGRGFYSDEIMAKWLKPVTPERIERYRAIISNVDEEVYIAEADSQIIGVMVIRMADAKMGSLYVRRNPYGAVGSALVAKAVEQMKAAGHNYMILDASLPALAFYQRNGFVETGRGIRPGYEMEYVSMRLDF